jgi:hypothetical protein
MPDSSRYLKAMPPLRRPIPVSATTRRWLLVVAIVAAFGTVASSALAAPAFYGGISADGKVAVFSSKEQIVPGDTDQEEDVYVRSFEVGPSEYVTRQVSLGPQGGNDAAPARFDGISGDGRTVFFSTKEQLVAADGDHAQDVYVRDLVENRTILVSQGDAGCAAQDCGNGEAASNVLPGGVAPSGGVVFFGTDERLSTADGDNAFDVYARDLGGGTTTLVTAPDPSCLACVSAGLDSQFFGSDEAGTKAYFATEERLATADGDPGNSDIYEHDLEAGTTKLVSVSGICPPVLPAGQNCEPSYGGASADGFHVFFETNERLSGEDTDTSQDVYDWSGGAMAALSSIGPDGGNGEPSVTYAGTTPTGGVVYFQTDEALVASDTDLTQDVYQRTGGVTSVVSVGEGGKGSLAFPASFEWVSVGGAPLVVFTTAEALTSQDTDSAQDVYQRVGGVTTLVSIGPEGGNGETDAVFANWASSDGSRIFFTTAESLLTADADASQDIYMRSGSETTLVSAGQIGGDGAFSAGLRGVSTDGSRAFFTTQERLAVDDDFANEADLYSWSSGGTLLVSVKNSPDLVLGPPPPTLEGTGPTSPNPSTTPTIFGQAAAESLIKIYTTFDCSGEPAAQGTAEQLASPGLTVSAPVPLGSTTNFRATAESEGVVSPCSGAIAYKQEDPSPPSEEGGGGSGGGAGGGTGTGGGTSTGSGGGKSGGGSKGGNDGNGGGITYVIPLTRITFGPAFKTRLRRPIFRFLDSTGQPGTRFFCRVDKKHWTGCTSPVKLKRLGFGRHVFAVKAVNAIGASGPKPVKRPFKVVHR